MSKDTSLMYSVSFKNTTKRKQRTNIGAYNNTFTLSHFHIKSSYYHYKKIKLLEYKNFLYIERTITIAHIIITLYALNYLDLD